MKSVLRVAVLVLFAAAAACSKGATPEKAPAGGVVATVGAHAITREMVDLRLRAMQGGSVPVDEEVFALSQLIQGYLAVTVVNRYGETVSAPSAGRFWRESRPFFSQALSDAVAAAREDVVLRAFAMPEFAMSLIEVTFEERAPEADEAHHVFRFLREARKAPASFTALAKKNGYETGAWWVGPKELRAAGAADPFGAEGPALAEVFYPRLEQASPGTVLYRPVMTQSVFLVFRVDEKRGERIRVTVAQIPKPSLDDWFWGQVSDIPVDIVAPAVRDKFVRAVPWARMLRSKDGRYPIYVPETPPGPWRRE